MISDLREIDPELAYPTPPSSPVQSKIVDVVREPESDLQSFEFVPHPNPPPVATQPKETPSAVPEEHTGSEINDQDDITNLKLQLGLEELRCRYPTVKKIPCKMTSSKAKYSEVLVQLKTLKYLTQSSPELDVELRKLAKLLHCRFHDDGRRIASRAEIWLQTFPRGDADVESLVSVEKQIQKLLGEPSASCPELLSNDKPCGQSLGGRKVMNYTRTIREIVKPEVCSKDDYLRGFLDVLITNKFCCHHQHSQEAKKMAWKAKIIDIWGNAKKSEGKGMELTNSGASDKSERETVVSIGEESREPEIEVAEVIDNVVSESQHQQFSIISDDLLVKFTQDPMNFWSEEYDVTPFSIIEKSDRLCDYESSYNEIRKVMKRSLERREEGHGHVYMYEVEGNKGFIKIGFTGRSIEERHKEWTFDCNRLPKLLYPVTTTPTKIPHAGRVEALCHAELSHRRLRIECKGCLKQHIEWFEISPADAIEVIKKWSRWIATQPYHQQHNLRSGYRWVLKSEELRQSRDISLFMKGLSQTSITSTALETRSENAVAAVEETQQVTKGVGIQDQEGRADGKAKSNSVAPIVLRRRVIIFANDTGKIALPDEKEVS